MILEIILLGVSIYLGKEKLSDKKIIKKLNDEIKIKEIELKSEKEKKELIEVTNRQLLKENLSIKHGDKK